MTKWGWGIELSPVFGAVRGMLGAPTASFGQESDSDRLGDAFALPPLREEGAPAPGIALAGWLGADDPVHPEVPEVLPRLAPGGDHAQPVEESEGERPDRAFGAASSAVDVRNSQLALCPDRASQTAEL